MARIEKVLICMLLDKDTAMEGGKENEPQDYFESKESDAVPLLEAATLTLLLAILQRNWFCN